MTKEQFLLNKLAEEAVEVAQRALKQVQFGPLQKQIGQDLTNQQRLKDEMLDLIAVHELLVDLKETLPIRYIDIVEALSAKRIKLRKYLSVSQTLGQLPEEIQI